MFCRPKILMIWVIIFGEKRLASHAVPRDNHPRKRCRIDIVMMHVRQTSSRGHKTSKKWYINLDATSWHLIEVETMFFPRNGPSWVFSWSFSTMKFNIEKKYATKHSHPECLHHWTVCVVHCLTNKVGDSNAWDLDSKPHRCRDVSDVFH